MEQNCQDAISFITLSKEFKDNFISLSNQMSPENLHCDGEITYAQAMRKLRWLKSEWKLLETKCGCKVTEEEVEKYQWRKE